jgi:hypothetical protein
VAAIIPTARTPHRTTQNAARTQSAGRRFEFFTTVEAAGVEPASATGSSRASTCIDRRLVSSLSGRRSAFFGTSCLKSHPRPDSTTERPARICDVSGAASGELL